MSAPHYDDAAKARSLDIAAIKLAEGANAMNAEAERIELAAGKLRGRAYDDRKWAESHLECCPDGPYAEDLRKTLDDPAAVGP